MKGGDKDIEKCVKTKCELVAKDAIKVTKKIKKIFVDSYKQKIKKCKTEKNNKECTNLEETKKFLKKINKNSDKINKKTRKLAISNCKFIYCNKENCKDTLFEPGKNPSIMNKIKNKNLIKLFEEKRKQIFGKKTDVLKDGFYEKLKPSEIEKLKKQGAISGCLEKIPNIEENTKKIEKIFQ